MQRTFSFICGLLALLCASGVSHATENQRRVLVLDLSDSLGGVYVEDSVRDCLKGCQVRRIVDLEDIAPAARKKWDAVFFVKPLNPQRYPENVRSLLRGLIADEKTGLMVWGLPDDKDDADSVLRFLGKRAVAVLGTGYLSRITADAFWIWANEAKDAQTVRFRKKFQVQRLPRKAFLLTTADNSGEVWLNGKSLVSMNDWCRIFVCDITSGIVVGENIIAAECGNVSGPAGFLLEILFQDEDKTGWSTLTDSTWKQSEKSPAGWTALSFDDSSWGYAAKVESFGQGPWRGRVNPACEITENALEIVNPAHPATLGLRGAAGTANVTYTLIPKNNAVGILKVRDGFVCVADESAAGTKTMIIPVNLEYNLLENERTNILKSETFRGFSARSAAWLAGGEMKEDGGKSALPKRSAAANAGRSQPGRFPAAMQVSRLPRHFHPVYGKSPGELNNRKSIRDIVDNIADHGFTSLYLTSVDSPVIDYARERGMTVTANLGDAELFGRNAPPEICVYSARYEAAVEAAVLSKIQAWAGVENLAYMFPYQDEPFHWGEKSFGYNREVFNEFKKRYGYDMPETLEAARRDPRKWLDVINFRSDYFSDGWRKVYKIIKKHRPGLNVIMTHDSHNTLGAAVRSQGQIAVDDVFHWGGDFADIFVFDMYPYMMVDFRYGKNAEIPKPRMAQTHYAMGQMRNLTRTYQKKFGFWFGTYNDTWFKLDDERKSQYWLENEMCYTAIANDADFLCAGINIPQDQKHWDALGKGMNIIQKAGDRLLETRRVKSKAAFLFPRTQYIQLQEEYWNVAQSYEWFLRAFGELDIIHEEQITDPSLNGYKILVLCDVKLLPAKVAENIERFVRGGGIVIADCAPAIGACREPMRIMEKLFGIADPSSRRIIPQEAYSSLSSDKDELKGIENKDFDNVETVAIRGRALGNDFNFMAVSPRPCRNIDGEELLSTSAGTPALIRKSTGKGRTYLLGFCMQDTYFNTWVKEDGRARAELYRLLSVITADAGVKSHVHSSNPEIEAAVRANAKEAFLFVINHESASAKTEVTLSGLPFEVGGIVNVDTKAEVPFTVDGDVIRMEMETPNDTRTCLFNIRPTT